MRCLRIWSRVAERNIANEKNTCKIITDIKEGAPELLGHPLFFSSKGYFLKSSMYEPRRFF